MRTPYNWQRTVSSFRLRERIRTRESPGLTLLYLEQLTGCTHEELGSALWYLCEKRWAKFGDGTEYSITAGGFDVVESMLGTQHPALRHPERDNILR